MITGLSPTLPIETLLALPPAILLQENSGGISLLRYGKAPASSQKPTGKEPLIKRQPVEQAIDLLCVPSVQQSFQLIAHGIEYERRTKLDVTLVQRSTNEVANGAMNKIAAATTTRATRR